MAAEERRDPFRAFNFVVEIEKTPVAGFSVSAAASPPRVTR